MRLFYEDYITFLGYRTRQNTSNIADPTVTYLDKNGGYLTKELRQKILDGSTSILCASNLPEGKITVQMLNKFEGTSRAIVIERFQYDQVAITTDLNLVDNRWEINNIACPTGR